MDCKRADNQLIDFLYGDLAPSEREAFERHLQECPRHAREVEKARGLLRLVRSQAPEEMPAELSERILRRARAALPERPRPGLLFGLRLNPVAAGAVLVVVMITVGIAVMQMGEKVREEELARKVSEPREPVAAPSPETVTVLERAKTEESDQEPAPGSIGAPEERPVEQPRWDQQEAPKREPSKARRKARKGMKKRAPGAALSERLQKTDESKFGGLDSSAGRALGVRGASPGAKVQTGAGGSLSSEASPFAEASQDRLAKEGNQEGGISQPAKTPSPEISYAAPRAAAPSAKAKKAVREKPAPAKKAERRFASPPPPPSQTPARPPSVMKDAEESVDVSAAPEPASEDRALHEGDEAGAGSDDGAESVSEEEASSYAKAPEDRPLASVSVDRKESRRERPVAGEVAEAEAPPDPYGVAEDHLANQRYDQAVAAYRRFLQQSPHDPRAPTGRYRIAKALFLSGKCRQAVTAIDRAVSASPRHGMAPTALLDQASCHVRLNQFQRAAAVYRRIERDYPAYREEARRGMERIGQ